MNHLNIHIDSYEVDGEPIIAGIHTIINATDRIAIVGPNGVGKSTFLRIISGEVGEYNGSIENIGNISLGYLEQIQFLDVSKSVRDELRDAFTEIRNLEETIRVEEKNLEENGEYEKYTEAIERYKYLGGYTYENEIERVARGIGIYHLLEKRLCEVSGGERTKIALAHTLLSRPDFLLLDEPTNFIDLASVEWLEKYLIETWKGGYMIVSHDREFLDNTVMQVIEILGPTGILITHGNYSDSVIEKEEKLKREKKLYEEQSTMIESEKELINRFRAGSRAGFAKSREKMLERVELIEKPYERAEIRFHFDTPKEKAPESLIRIEDAFIGRSDPLFFIREASLHVGERIGIVGENGVGKSTLIKTILGALPDPVISTEIRGSVIARSEPVSVANDVAIQVPENQSMDRFVPRDDETIEQDTRESALLSSHSGAEVVSTPHVGGSLSLELKRGDGRALSNDDFERDSFAVTKIEPQKLKVLEGFLHIAKNISVGYYSQMHETLDTTKTIEDNFHLHGLPYSKERIGGILKAFGFEYHDGARKVSSLSGGERSRLLFAFLCEYPYHLLILDEPTNHLDYDTREALERALRNYEGAILFISHDRYFVNKLSSKLWIIEDGELILSYGNYEDYRYKKEKGISLDMSLFDAEGEMSLVLEEKLGATEARRIKEKFARKKRRN